jgi:hypothetical protein
MANASDIQVQFGPFDASGNPLPAGPWQKYAGAGKPSTTNGAPGPWSKYAASSPANAMSPNDFDARFNGRPDISIPDTIATQMAQGLTASFSDELGGLLEGLAYRLHGKGSFGEGYNVGVNRIRGQDADAQTQHPVISTAAQIAGALPMVALPVGDAAEGASLAARIGRGMMQGGAYGGVAGAGGAQGGPEQRAVGAGEGALAGAATGGAIPVATEAVSTVARPVVNAIRARVNPESFAAQKVTETLAKDKMTADQAAWQLASGSSYGNNLALADIAGDNSRNLLRTTTNIPGPAADRVRTQVNVAQMAQGGRIKKALGWYLADPDSYQAAKEAIIADRASAAKPYYDAAWERPVPYTQGLESLLQTPAGKSALAVAKTNSLNRREPWAQWFASIDDNGNILDARRVPDMRALDEVKRVLDRQVEAAKTPADGSPFAKARHNAQSLAVQSVRDDLLGFLDRHNPAYAKARSVAMDNIQADEALEFGRNALTEDPRVIAKKMAGYNPGQRQLAKMGAAEAIRQKIDAAGFSQDVVKRIFNTRSQIAGLKALFADDPGAVNGFQNFLLNEARRVRTRAAVNGNSTTVKQLANMQEAGQIGESIATVGHVAHGNFIPLIVNALKRLGGLTPQVADHIARMLMTGDPNRVQSIVAAVRRIEQAKITSDQRNAALRGLLTRFAGVQEGRALESSPSGP